MAIDVKATNKIIAEGLFHDVRSRDGVEGLNAINAELTSNSDLKAWKKEFDALLTAANAGVFTTTRAGIATGAKRLQDITPGGIDTLKTEQLKRLVDFSGKGSVKSPKAQKFLQNFYEKTGSLLQEFVRDELLARAADKLTEFWAKNLPDLMAIVKQLPWENDSRLNLSIDQVNRLATIPGFDTLVRSTTSQFLAGSAKKFVVDPDKLVAWSGNPAVGKNGIHEMGAWLRDTKNSAIFKNDQFKNKLIDMERVFDSSVRSSLLDYQNAEIELAKLKPFQPISVSSRSP